MSKEKDLPAGRQVLKTAGGYSEKEMDLDMDKVGNVNQVKAKNIFDPKKKKEKIILDSRR
jgi:hypothetical protein